MSSCRNAGSGVFSGQNDCFGAATLAGGPPFRFVGSAFMGFSRGFHPNRRSRNRGKRLRLLRFRASHDRHRIDALLPPIRWRSPVRYGRDFRGIRSACTGTFWTPKFWIASWLAVVDSVKVCGRRRGFAISHFCGSCGDGLFRKAVEPCEKRGHVDHPDSAGRAALADRGGLDRTASKVEVGVKHGAAHTRYGLSRRDTHPVALGLVCSEVILTGFPVSRLWCGVFRLHG